MKPRDTDRKAARPPTDSSIGNGQAHPDHSLRRRNDRAERFRQPGMPLPEQFRPPTIDGPHGIRSSARTHVQRPRRSQIPIEQAASSRLTHRGFLPWRLSDDGPGARATSVSGRHPKPFTTAAVRLAHRRRTVSLPLLNVRCATIGSSTPTSGPTRAVAGTDGSCQSTKSLPR